MRSIMLVLVASVALLVGACDLIGERRCSDGSDRWVEYRLYMGRGGTEGEVVTDAHWDKFLGDTVTPRFPDGLTVLDGRGQWLGGGGEIQKERSKVLVILVADDDEEAEKLIHEVSEDYKRRFAQEAVLKTVNKTCVAFQ